MEDLRKAKLGKYQTKAISIYNQKKEKKNPLFYCLILTVSCSCLWDPLLFQSKMFQTFLQTK